MLKLNLANKGWANSNLFRFQILNQTGTWSGKDIDFNYDYNTLNTLESVFKNISPTKGIIHIVCEQSFSKY